MNEYEKVTRLILIRTDDIHIDIIHIEDLMLNLYHLRYFVDAVNLTSMTDSARKNCVTLSTVSQGIRGLESHLGVTLLVHQRQAVSLTTEGQEVYKEAMNLLYSAERFVLNAGSAGGHTHEKLRIASSHSLAAALLPGLLKPALAQWPDLEVAVRISGPRSIAKVVRLGEADCALGLRADFSFQEDLVTVRKGNFVLAVGLGCEIIAPAKVRFLLGDFGPEVTTFINAYRAVFSRVSIPAMRLESWLVMAKFAQEGFGVALLPDFFLTVDSGLKIYELAPGFTSFGCYEVCAAFAERADLVQTSGPLAALRNLFANDQGHAGT